MQTVFSIRGLIVTSAILAAIVGGIARDSSNARASDIDGAAISYSQGAHQYFAGNLADAKRFLAQAIELNPDDPRPYYFRAMAHLRQGETDLARKDMYQGAELEARLPGRYDIGGALQRIQGTERLMLENYRREARITESQRYREHTQLRYEQLQRREPEVQRQKAEVRLDEFVDPAMAKQLVMSPIASEPEGSPGTTDAEAGDAVGAFEDDPFADDPVEANSAAAGEGFGDDGSQTPAKMSSSKLFGVLGRAVQNTIPVPAWSRTTGLTPGGPPESQDDFSSASEEPASESGFEEMSQPLPPQDSTPEKEDPFGENTEEDDPFEGS